MTYILHYAPDNASLIIRLALEHLGLPFTAQLVDRAQGAQSSEAYRALNPNGLIPVLETPHGPIFETGAILLWLTDTHGRIGPSAQDRGRGDYLKWLFYTANTLHPALRMMFYPDKYIATAQTAALREGLQAQVKTALRQLDQIAASNSPWVGGAQPSGIDFYIAACLRWSALYPTDHDRSWFALADTPALASTCARIEALPACHALQTAEGLGDTPFTDPVYANPPQGSAT